MKIAPTDQQVSRFWQNVTPLTNGCWIWVGAIDKDGFGRIKVGGQNFSTHRFVWLITFGEPRFNVLHKCHNPACVNPFHLRDGKKQSRRKSRMPKLPQDVLRIENDVF